MSIIIISVSGVLHISASEKSVQGQFLPDDTVYNEIIAQYASDMNTQALELVAKFPDINAISQAARKYISGYGNIKRGSKKLLLVINKNIITNFINPLIGGLHGKMQLSTATKNSLLTSITLLEDSYKLDVTDLSELMLHTSFVPEEFIALLLDDQIFINFMKQRKLTLIQQKLLLLFMYHSYISLKYNSQKCVFESILSFGQGDEKIIITQKQLNVMMARLFQVSGLPDFGFNNNPLLFYAIDTVNTDLFEILMQNGASLDAKRYLLPDKLGQNIIDILYNRFVGQYRQVFKVINLYDDKINGSNLSFAEFTILSLILKKITAYQRMLKMIESKNNMWFQAHIVKYANFQNKLQEIINIILKIKDEYFSNAMGKFLWI
ncbi:hypothetical protein J120_04045 [candidate division TM6 bacterium JCVI TM6SC1]|uniref:Uncharacterized protein n=1 Tax=candidate division TM6 bacterium JCVI TM6SC1 TaxID=1306947 RepID=A0A0D2GNV7_9BACT|nr:hypothetical protein J120_04045 [candidate division TM6 bacterium JCVI TM6SC1]